MSPTPDELKKLSEKMDKIESEIVRAKGHLSTSEKKLQIAVTNLDPMRAQIKSAKKRVQLARERKRITLCKIGESVNVEGIDCRGLVSQEVDASTLSILSDPVAEFDLSKRASGCLDVHDLCYIGDLVQCVESKLLREVPNLGRESMNEIKGALALRGLSLGMNLANWRRQNS